MVNTLEQIISVLRNLKIETIIKLKGNSIHIINTYIDLRQEISVELSLCSRAPEIHGERDLLEILDFAIRTFTTKDIFS